MKHIRLFVLTLLIHLSVCTTWAQQFTFQHLDTENGLINNYITDLAQDKRGYLWIATEEGLSRFDGHYFTSYNTENSGLQNNALNTLLYDKRSDTLWIGTKAGLYILHCSTQEIEQLVLPKDALLDNVVYLSFATDGDIWITNLYHSIIKYNPTTHKYTVLGTPNIKGIHFAYSCAIDDGKGHLYVGHSQAGMSIIDLKDLTLHTFKHSPDDPKSIPSDWVTNIYIDHFQNIWVGTKQGLALFNPQRGNFTKFHHQLGDSTSILSDDICHIAEIDDKLWIASDLGGVSILNLRDLTLNDLGHIQFQNISITYDTNGISSKNARKVFKDSFGNIWIGNHSSGLDFISRTQPAFHSLPYVKTGGRVLQNKPAKSIYTEGNKVWIGGDNELVLFMGNKLIESYSFSNPNVASNGQINAIVRYKDDLLLGMSDAGILRFNPQTRHTTRIPLTKSTEATYCFFTDTDGKIWIGAEGGLYSYQKGRLHQETAIGEQMHFLSVYGIVRDAKGLLWIGSYGDGIYVFDKKDQLIHHITDEKGLCTNAVIHLYQDRKKRIWAATRDGLNCFAHPSRPEDTKRYRYDEGLKDVYVRAIYEDKLGYIWISTTENIACLNPKTQEIASYSRYDGIQARNFSDGSVAASSDGTIYFGSLNGVCYFHPKDIVREQTITPVGIVECLGISGQIEEGSNPVLQPTAHGKIELPYAHNSFRIRFTIPDFSQSPMAEYAYLVDGLSNNWTNTQGENQVTFRNLPPGEYTFKVKARLHNQDWDNKHIAKLKVYIHPPLWQTWYAQTCYAIILIIGTIFWFRFYKRRLKLKSSLELEREKSHNEQELNQERLRFYTNITHELRTPLTLIIGPLEDLINDAKLPKAYSQKISVIHGSALRLLNLVNQILEFRKTETQNRKLAVSKGNLHNLVTEIGLRYKELNRNEQVTFQLDIPSVSEKIYYDSDVISTILNNLLSNAVKYTVQGEIKLELHQVQESDNQYTEILVSDTGYGIDAEALPYIFDRYYQVKGKHQASGTGIGLALVKSLVDLHEGTLQVESASGKGTTFVFRILTYNCYPNALHKEDKPEAAHLETSQDLKAEAETDNRPLILIIEDNDDIREYIAASFNEDYRILTAINGQEGWTQAQEDIPDIIISDIMMPVMNGIELCKLVKGDIRTSHIPVILLTAKDSIHDKEEGYDSGADSYLTKPFSAKLLHSRINNLLESRKKLAHIIAQQQTHDIENIPDNAPATSTIVQPSEDVKLSRLDEEFLQRLTDIVSENLAEENLDISFLTQKMHMSTSTLYRKIKSLTGMSGNEFIRKFRLKQGLRLMLKEGYNISEAAYACGFNDSGYFRNCFKQTYGMTPSEYLKNIKS